ncbi:MAG: hypothetical protein WC867_07550 [Candidatus Pacearchaeota archaeon]|jgi:hypothetical protein
MKFLFPDISIKLSILNPIENFESKGYLFFNDWTMDFPFVPDRIKLPSGRILSLEEIDKELLHLEVGNKSQIECLNALEYYDLIRNLPTDVRNNYSSFIDCSDVELCKKKYN